MEPDDQKSTSPQPQSVPQQPRSTPSTQPPLPGEDTAKFKQSPDPTNPQPGRKVASPNEQASVNKGEQDKSGQGKDQPAPRLVPDHARGSQASDPFAKMQAQAQSSSEPGMTPQQNKKRDPGMNL